MTQEYRAVSEYDRTKYVLALCREKPWAFEIRAIGGSRVHKSRLYSISAHAQEGAEIVSLMNSAYFAGIVQGTCETVLGSYRPRDIMGELWFLDAVAAVVDTRNNKARQSQELIALIDKINQWGKVKKNTPDANSQCEGIGG